MTPGRVNYRKLALDRYGAACAYCGFGIRAVLEVAHLDGDRSNNAVENLVVLCPTCHKMLDIDLIPNEVILVMRDRVRQATWKKRMKDAGAKAKRTRLLRARAKKAVETRRANQQARGRAGRMTPPARPPAWPTATSSTRPSSATWG